ATRLLGPGIVGILVFVSLVEPRAVEAKGKAAKAAKAVVAPGGCEDGAGATIWVSPQTPVAGTPVQILAVAEGGAPGELVATGDGGKRLPLAPVRRGTAPVSLSAELPSVRAGKLRLVWSRGDKPAACREVEVAAHAPRAERAVESKVVWASERRWDRRMEDFYAAWIERLFDAPPDKSVEFRPLHQALRDPARNFLYGYLGLREDDPKNKAAIKATPDCADLPYFLRAYFSWKLGLPFGFRDCDRGNESRPPRCTTFYSNDDAPNGKDTLAAVKSFFRQLANRVQSGSARTG